MLSPTIAATAATTITATIEKWCAWLGCASSAAAISAVSPGSGTPADSTATSRKSSASP